MQGTGRAVYPWRESNWSDRRACHLLLKSVRSDSCMLVKVSVVVEAPPSLSTVVRLSCIFPKKKKAIKHILYKNTVFTGSVSDPDPCSKASWILISNQYRYTEYGPRSRSLKKDQNIIELLYTFYKRSEEKKNCHK